MQPNSKKKRKRVKPLWSGVQFYTPASGELGSLGRQDFIIGGGGGGRWPPSGPVDTIILRRRTSNNLTPGALALLPAVLCGNSLRLQMMLFCYYSTVPYRDRQKGMAVC